MSFFLQHAFFHLCLPTRLHVKPAKKRSVCVSEYSLSTIRCFGTLAILRKPCEDSDQTVRIGRLIFAMCKCNLVRNAAPPLIYKCILQISEKNTIKIFFVVFSFQFVVFPENSFLKYMNHVQQKGQRMLRPSCPCRVTLYSSVYPK